MNTQETFLMNENINVISILGFKLKVKKIKKWLKQSHL